METLAAASERASVITYINVLHLVEKAGDSRTDSMVR